MIDIENLSYYRDAAESRVRSGESVAVHPEDLLELVGLYLDRIY